MFRVHLNMHSNLLSHENLCVPGVLNVCEGASHAGSHGGGAVGVKGRCNEVSVGPNQHVNGLHNARSAASEDLPEPPFLRSLSAARTLLAIYDYLV